MLASAFFSTYSASEDLPCAFEVLKPLDGTALQKDPYANVKESPKNQG